MAQKFVSPKDDVVELLLKENSEFRQLFKEHQSLEAQLEEIDTRKHLSSDEQMERKRIQKRKLYGKDRMEEILRTHSQREFATI